MRQLYIALFLLLLGVIGTYYMIVQQVNLSRYYPPKAGIEPNYQPILPLPTPKPGLSAPPIRPGSAPTVPLPRPLHFRISHFQPKLSTLPPAILYPRLPPVTPMPAPAYAPVTPIPILHQPQVITAPTFAPFLPQKAASPSPSPTP